MSTQDQIKVKIEKLKKAWNAFVKKGEIVTDNLIVAEVLSSWIRSKNRKIDYEHVPEQRLTAAELDFRLRKNKNLLTVAVPFLQSIAADVEGSGFRVDLFDADCYLLWTQGDNNILKDSKERSLISPGICRSEKTCGTNAINLARLLERPVQLLGPEHYNAALQHWTCAAVPIKDEQGQVIAIINAAGYYWLIHKHTLGMMAALSKSIEYCLLQQSVQRKLEQTNKFYKDVMDSSTDALVVVDARGRIMLTNAASQKNLGLGLDCEGEHVETIWGRRNPFSEVLEGGAAILDREISFVRKSKVIRLIGSIRPIELVDSRLQGVVGNFKAQNHTRGIIKNFVGWKAHFSFEHLVGESRSFCQVVRLAKETAKIGSNVLIQGESGTGKELFAQAIHNDSEQNDGPFVAINCAAIPSGLIESELFGYEGGAFTGAKKAGQPGKFELAEGGSIFLDEINSLPLEMQAKILRTLQNKTVVRLGGRDEIPVRIRVISASNKDLWQLVQKGEFREDLFYRINVITINLPPLRERKGDLDLLLRHILNGKKIPIDTFDESAVQALRSYTWPGNVRELENVLERSFVFSHARGSIKVEREDILNYPGIERAMQKSAFANDLPVDQHETVVELKVSEKQTILRALQTATGNVSAAARLLGIPRNTLYRKMKKLELR